MRNRTIEVTASDINKKENIVVNATLILTSTGLGCDLPTTPQRIYFENSSGEDIEFNILTQKEVFQFNSNPSTFVGIKVANGETFRHHEIFGSDKLENVYYIVVKGLGTSASNPVTIYLLDYK